MATKRTRTSRNALASVATDNAEPALPVIRPKALVFVSHDSRDADIAEAFANLLSDVSAGTLKSFRSSDKRGTGGIEFGAEWYTSIMSQLDDATDVVALLTARSLDRPWILYEAGVAKGKLGTTVLGLALGVPLEKVSTGPFGQFQNCADDEDSLTKLVMQLLQRNPDAAPREEAVRMQVKLFIEGLSKLLATKHKRPSDAAASDDQGVAKLFEEVKAMVRELPERVDDRVRIASKRSNARGLRHVHPKMLDDLVFRAMSGSGTRAMSLLLILSFARDDVPWLYELGMEVYRAMRLENRSAVVEANKQFEAATRLMLHGPLGREFMRGDEEVYYFLRSIPELVERAVTEYLALSLPRRRLTKTDEPPLDAAQA
jgi:hypothetical protein